MNLNDMHAVIPTTHAFIWAVPEAWFQQLMVQGQRLPRPPMTAIVSLLNAH